MSERRTHRRAERKLLREVGWTNFTQFRELQIAFGDLHRRSEAGGPRPDSIHLLVARATLQQTTDYAGLHADMRTFPWNRDVRNIFGTATGSMAEELAPFLLVLQ